MDNEKNKNETNPKEEKKEINSKEEKKEVKLSPKIDELRHVLSELVDTKFWTYIMQFNRLYDGEIFNTLLSLDPNTQQTQLARNQGLREGLYSLELFIVQSIEEMKGTETDSKDNIDQEDSLIYG